MGKALYRKYRSKSLGELVGQPHITKTLENALKNGKIAHAYLFTGPRGVGKTSVARILAHAINKLPYNDDSAHIDIIEIDAASNRGIEDARELREKVHIAPTSADFKVYIIDEAHMLTTPAFNALLKTLEEPPAHVVLILATTEAHKLPETIISRTQRFTFKPISVHEVKNHLRFIAGEEGIDITDDALKLIAEHGHGSFRDSISLLDQARSFGKKISVENIEEMLGQAPTEKINKLLEALAAGNASECLKILSGFSEYGTAAALIAKQLIEIIRHQILSGEGVLQTSSAPKLMERLLAVPASQQGYALLEIICLEFALQNVSSDKSVEKATEMARAVSEHPTEEPSIKTVYKSAENTEKLWGDLLKAVRKSHSTLYGVIRMAEARFNKNALTLLFAFAFHQKRASEAKYKKVLSDQLKDLTGEIYSIECVHDKSAKPTSTDISTSSTTHASTTNKQPAGLNAISNIFGGAEVLE